MVPGRPAERWWWSVEKFYTEGGLVSARESTWRPIVRPHIRRVIAENSAMLSGHDPKGLRKAYRKAYPFVVRRGWQYRVWLQEIDRQEAEFRKFSRWQQDRGGFEDQVLAWLKG